jgi:hypothetical protein
MTRHAFQAVPREGVERFAAGDEPSIFVPGDFILTRNQSVVAKVIRFGQRLRIHGADRTYCWTSHAAMIVSEQGDLIEALSPGSMRTHISKYRSDEYVVVHTGASEHDRAQAVAFAEHTAGLRAQARQRYGFLTILSIALMMLTGGKFVFAVDGQTICSGLVARCQERCGVIFSRTPTHVYPADLAKYYGIPTPA